MGMQQISDQAASRVSTLEQELDEVKSASQDAAKLTADLESKTAVVDEAMKKLEAKDAEIQEKSAQIETSQAEIEQLKQKITETEAAPEQRVIKTRKLPN